MNQAIAIPEANVQVIRIGVAMSDAGLPDAFVSSAVELAFVNEGIRDLLLLWAEAGSSERDEIVADVQELIDDYSHPGRPVEKAYIRFDDLDHISKHVRLFKDSLRLRVDHWGGISKLAEATGMPQPSLSRFFSSDSMPRRATLLRIASALELAEVEIATQWVND